MKALCWFVPAFAIWCCAVGCAGFQTELLESQLRQREDEALLVKGQLHDAQSQLTACRRENGVLRSQLRDAGAQGMLPEQAAALFSVEKIALNRLMTGGIDTDGNPGDDALSVVIEPRDQQGDVLKSPGTIAIELLDLALDPVDRRVGYWTFDLETALKHWQGGLFGTGYQFKLPWQRGYPRHANLTLHARLLTPDGRAFRATETITVRLVAGTLPEGLGTRPTASPPPTGVSEAYSAPASGSILETPPAAEPVPLTRETPATIPSPPPGEAASVRVPHAVSPAPGSGFPAAAPSDGFSRERDDHLDRLPLPGLGWRPVPTEPTTGPILHAPGGAPD